MFLKPMPFRRSIRLAWAVLLGVSTVHALPSAPTVLSQIPSALSSEVTLTWTSVPGATGYKVKRGASPTSALTTLATITTTFAALDSVSAQRVDQPTPDADRSGTSATGVSTIRRRRHHVMFSRTITWRTYASGEPSRTRDQCRKVFANAACTRSSAMCRSPVSR